MKTRRTVFLNNPSRLDLHHHPLSTRTCRALMSSATSSTSLSSATACAGLLFELYHLLVQLRHQFGQLCHCLDQLIDSRITWPRSRGPSHSSFSSFSSFLNCFSGCSTFSSFISLLKCFSVTGSFSIEVLGYPTLDERLEIANT